MKKFLYSILTALFVSGLLMASGCATSDSEHSDIPWNAPEPWEGSPYIPGMN